MGALFGGVFGNASSFLGRPLSQQAPTNAQAYVWNGYQWVPTTTGGGVTGVTSLEGLTGVLTLEQVMEAGYAPIAGQAFVFNGTIWTPTTVVASVAVTDGSIVKTGTATVPSLATGTLDAIATAHPPVNPVAMNAEKITGLANGTAASDGAAFGQIPVPANGYGIGGNTGATPTPAVSLTRNHTDLVGSGNVNISNLTLTTILTTPSLAIGTWKISGIVTYAGGTTVGDTINTQIEAGTAVVSSGLPAGGQLVLVTATAADNQFVQPFETDVIVTTAGTFIVGGIYQTAGVGTVKALAASGAVVANTPLSFVNCLRIA